MLTPEFTEFARMARSHELVPVWRELVFDRDTAVAAYARIARPPFAFLLESVVGGEKWARFTFMGTEPRSAWRLDGDGRVATWEAGAGWSAPRAVADPLAGLEAVIGSRAPAHARGLPRFLGGAVGYLSYDVVRHIERLGPGPADDAQLPAALFLFTDVVLAIDNLTAIARAITLVDTAGADEAELRRRYEDARVRIDALVARLDSDERLPPLELRAHARELALDDAFPRHRFVQAVTRAREYIAAGDVFQVVLSRRLSLPLEAHPFDVYRALRSLNPSPYLYYLEMDGVTLAGSSPEVLVRLDDGVVTVRPIAGTRPRGTSPEEDERLVRELLDDPKERAEHLMLVDLGRNDVGRVCEFGSVSLSQYSEVERYSHVSHLVSQVEGRLKAGLSAVDVLRACFPAGTVSGAPKIRAMEIIDELEPTRRGPYAGAVGYLAWGGAAMDTAIAIRTLIAARGRAFVQAGAGIVADSDPGAEYRETEAKAGALLRVLGTVGARRQAGGSAAGSGGT